MKKLLTFFTLLLVSGWSCAENVKTVFNPFTGKQDYITSVNNQNFVAGTNVTVTCNNGACTFDTTGGGGGTTGTINAANQFSLPYYSFVGSSTTLSGFPGVTASTNTGIIVSTFTLASKTMAQAHALTPGTTGQMYYCTGNDCTTSIFVSTGVKAGAFLYNGLRSTSGRDVCGGNGACASITTAVDNTIIGHNAGAALTAGNGNIMIGSSVGLQSVLGSGNILIGDLTGNQMSSLNRGNNTSVGYVSMPSVTTGIMNSSLGSNAAWGFTTGSSNTIVGAHYDFFGTEPFFGTDDNGIIALGFNTLTNGTTGPALNNSVIIGNNVQVTSSNTIMLGGTGVNSLMVNLTSATMSGQLFLAGSAGTAGQVATSGGVSGNTTWTTVSGSGGGSGTTNLANQFSLPYYSAIPSSNVLSGFPDATVSTNTGVFISTVAASSSTMTSGTITSSLFFPPPPTLGSGNNAIPISTRVNGKLQYYGWFNTPNTYGLLWKGLTGGLTVKSTDTFSIAAINIDLSNATVDAANHVGFLSNTSYTGSGTQIAGKFTADTTDESGGNYGVWTSATAGSTNYGLWVNGGLVHIDPLSASLPLQLDSNKNMTATAIDLSGSQVTGVLATGSLPSNVVYNNSAPSATFSSSVTFTTSISVSSNTIMSGATFYQNAPSAISSATINTQLKSLGSIFISTGPVVRSTYTLTSADSVVLASAAPNGIITIQLPAVTSSNGGQFYSVTKVDKSTGSVKVQVAGTDLIANTTGTLVLYAPGQRVMLVSDGVSGWQPVGSVPSQNAWIGDTSDPNAGTAIQVANDARCQSYSLSDFSIITGVRFPVVAQSGNIDVGIYANNGVRLTSSGSTAVAAAGVQGITFATPAYAAPGPVWLCIAIDNITATIRSPTSSDLVGTCEIASSFPLPATLTFSGCTAASKKFAEIATLLGGPQN